MGKSQSHLFNRSMYSNRGQNFESINEGNNFLDELNDEKRKLDPKESLMDLVNKFNNEILK